MSKDDSCKVTSASKHKERKPKKPHYIPRPWGKPYNYKCFQCPFTCMEKSHLYNHMKYSLCKNSLSLLIESDWPYKKGNILHPEQLRPFQQAQGFHFPGTDESERETQSEEPKNLEEELEKKDDEEERGAGRPADHKPKEPLTKPPKVSEGELLMTDVFNLEDQLLQTCTAEVPTQAKHYNPSKTRLPTPGLLSDQWRLFLSGHTKTKPEEILPRVGGSFPCYSPPPNLADYQDLSMFGLGYPISPALISYMNSAVSAPSAGLSAQTHAHLAQLPFLASAAQLMYPAHSDRTLVPPRLFYPFPCEHSLGPTSRTSDPAKPLKPSSNTLEGNPPPKGLWKVPSLQTGSGPGSADHWVASQRDFVEQNFQVSDKLPTGAKDGRAGWDLKRSGGPLGKLDPPQEKRAPLGLSFDVLKNIHAAASITETNDRLGFQKRSSDSQLQTWPNDLWVTDLLPGPKCCRSSSLSSCGRSAAPSSACVPTVRDASSESADALLRDLSKALQEYQTAEGRISLLEKEELPVQRHLWDHLSKIRSELTHIHQALERTARQSDGPLDLSLKRDATTSSREDDGSDTEEDEEEEEEAARKALRASRESRKQSLDMLIKMSGTATVDAEVLSPAGLAVGPGPAEASWPGRTTKCEADSSVLLCPDGRSVVFTDMAASSKASKRTSSLQRAETQGRPSPEN